MGKMRGIALGLALMLGLGIISKKYKGGLGLGEMGLGLSGLGTGLVDIGIAPFRAFGGGLGELATGFTSFAGALGDIGRGLADLFANIPGLPTIPGPGLPGPSGPRPEDRDNGNGNGWAHLCAVCGQGFSTYNAKYSHMVNQHPGTFLL